VIERGASQELGQGVRVDDPTRATLASARAAFSQVERKSVVVGNFFLRLYGPQRDDASPRPTLAVQLGFDLGVRLASVVDPPGLIDHVEIEAVVDPQAIPIVNELLLLIEDPLDIGDGLARLKASDGADAVSVNGRAKNADTRGVGHGGDVARFAVRDPSFGGSATSQSRWLV
jgi:hypothetical protein